MPLIRIELCDFKSYRGHQVIGPFRNFTSVIGPNGAGKSTLMGRLLYELGALDEKTRTANERGSSKVGKRSFAWAWNFDGTLEERERYVY